MPGPTRLLLVALSGVAGACAREPTQLVVVIDTDLEVPGEVDALEVEVEGADGARTKGPFALDGTDAVDLPASFGVAPRDRDATRHVTVRLRGSKDGAERLSTFARTGFVEHERLRLDLFLARRCLAEGLDCAAQGLTCTEDGCVDPDRDPRGLPRWDGVLPARDAGGLDAGPDAAGDAGPRCPDEPAGPGILAWATTPDGAPVVSDAAGTPEGGALVVGNFTGPVAFADGTCRLADDAGVWIARLDSAGALEWLQSFGGGTQTEPGDVRVAVNGEDASQALVAFGLHAGDLAIGGVTADTGDGRTSRSCSPSPTSRSRSSPRAPTTGRLLPGATGPC